MWIYILVGVIILIIIYALIMYNSFIKLDNKVKESFSTMDVYLKKRWDLIPNIVEVVKGYSKYEEKVLNDIVKLRNNVYDTMSDDDKIKTNEELSSYVSKMFSLVEGYPELKSSENYKELISQLTKVEEDIANSRKYYNGVVRIYNNKVEMFPNNIFASIFRYKTKSMFEVSIDERNNVDVNI